MPPTIPRSVPIWCCCNARRPKERTSSPKAATRALSCFPPPSAKSFSPPAPPSVPGGDGSDLQQQGETATLKQILAEQQRRDEEDATREVGPLRRADDAREVLTDGLTQEQVVDKLEGLVRERMR